MGDLLWLKVRFRDDEVLARADAAGELVVDAQGFVDFRYQPGGKTYRSRPDRFAPAPGATPGPLVAEPKPAAKAAAGASVGASRRPGVAPRAAGSARGVTFAAGGGGRPEALRFWTDGACSGNPGPAGSGVFAELGGGIWELSEYLGHSTNNVAELTAILRALERVEDPTAPVDVLSDSEYGLKVAAKLYKAKKNLDLVEQIWAQLARFTDLRLVKVPAHVGIAGNERADELARLAISARATASVERSALPEQT